MGAERNLRELDVAESSSVISMHDLSSSQYSLGTLWLIIEHENYANFLLSGNCFFVIYMFMNM
jgi:hypothetical protein